MALQIVDLPSMTIPSGGSTSNAVGILDDSWGIGLWTPGTLTGTVTVEVEPTDTGTNWAPLQSGGSDVSPAAGKHTTINPITYRRMRMTSGAVEAADRTFTLTKSVQV